MPKSQSKTAPLHYKTMDKSNVPQGRNGKHKQTIDIILKDLLQLPDGSALKVPLKSLVEGKAKVRSALNRGTRKIGKTVATATDDQFLYIWNVDK